MNPEQFDKQQKRLLGLTILFFIPTTFFTLTFFVYLVLELFNKG